MKNYKAYIDNILIITIIVCINIVSLYIYKRYDLTKTKAYSLSQATHNVIELLDAPVRIRLFFSKDLPGNLNNVRVYIRDLLAEYQTASRGNITFEFINPDSPERLSEEANKAKVAPVSIEVYEKDKVEFRDIFMGASVVYKQKNQIIPFFSDTEGLEFLLTNTIKKMMETRDRHIAYFQPVQRWALPNDNSIADEPQWQIPQNIAMFARMLSEVAVLDGTDLYYPLPQSTDLLIVNAVVDSLNMRQLFILDQYIMEGKPVIILTDRYLADLNNSPATLFNNNLLEMLRSYGIFVKPSLVLDTSCFMVSRLRTRNGVRVPIDYHYPFFPSVRSFSDSLAIHNNLRWVQSFYASEVFNLGQMHSTPLLWTSSTSSEIGGFEVNTDYQDYAEFDPERYNMPPKTLAMKFTGPLSSFFNDKDIPVNYFVDKTQDATIIVAGTTSLLDNALLSNNHDNQAFILNLIDYLTDHTDFIYMRNRNITHSPIADISYQQKSIVKYTNLILPFTLIAIFAGIFKLLFERRRERIRS